MINLTSVQISSYNRKVYYDLFNFAIRMCSLLDFEIFPVLFSVKCCCYKPLKRKIVHYWFTFYVPRILMCVCWAWIFILIFLPILYITLNVEIVILYCINLINIEIYIYDCCLQNVFCFFFSKYEPIKNM